MAPTAPQLGKLQDCSAQSALAAGQEESDASCGELCVSLHGYLSGRRPRRMHAHSHAQRSLRLESLCLNLPVPLMFYFGLSIAARIRNKLRPSE